MWSYGRNRTIYVALGARDGASASRTFSRMTVRSPNVLLDNRHGLVADVCASHATGTAEREAAAVLLDASAPPGSTVGADKNYDVRGFVATVRGLAVTPHVAQKVNTAIPVCRMIASAVRPAAWRRFTR